MRSSHYVSSVHTDVNWASPIALMAGSAVFLIGMTKIFGAYLMQWGFSLQEKEIEVDENLPNFFEVIKLSQADEVVIEEQNMKKNFGIQVNDPDTIRLLDDTKQPKKACQGTPWYTVLSNVRYQNNFNYIGAFIGEREKLIEDGTPEEFDNNNEMTESNIRTRCEQSDLIVVLLNLAVIPDEVVKRQTWSRGWQQRFKDNMDQYKANFKGFCDWKYQD